MKRCKHPNIVILEYCEEVQAHEFVNGQYDDTTSDAGLLLDYIDVSCSDCGLERRYYRGRWLPKWIARRIREMLEGRARKGGLIR